MACPHKIINRYTNKEHCELKTVGFREFYPDGFNKELEPIYGICIGEDKCPVIKII
jgi:hypothetical protein